MPASGKAHRSARQGSRVLRCSSDTSTRARSRMSGSSAALSAYGSARAGRRSLCRSRDATRRAPSRKLKATKVAAPEPGAGSHLSRRPSQDCRPADASPASLGSCGCTHRQSLSLLHHANQRPPALAQVTGPHNSTPSLAYACNTSKSYTASCSSAATALGKAWSYTYLHGCSGS